MTLREALELFIVQLEANGRSIHTIGQYERHLQAFDRWLVSEGLPVGIEAMTHEVIARFFGSEAARVRPDGKPKRGTSVNALRTSLRQFFSWCHEAGYLRENPARLLRRAICSPPPPRGLTDDEVDRLLKVLDSRSTFEANRDATLVRVLLGTGIRLHSALALRIEDVDLSARELEIRSAKRDQPDRLPISTDVTQILTEWVGPRIEGVLFPSRSGGRLCTRHVQRRFREAVLRAGIKRPASPHSCRHRFATKLLARTGDLALVQQALLHRSIASTLVYARVDQSRLRAAIG